MDSVIMTDNLATILDSEIDCVIGTFKAIPELDAALRDTLQNVAMTASEHSVGLSEVGKTR
jgi:hypothetical protein